jgi:hypothetical protein
MNNNDVNKALIGVTATDIQLIFEALDLLEEHKGNYPEMEQLTFELQAALQDINTINNNEALLEYNLFDADTMEIPREN